jgi:AraC-like DNA-binding protein
LDTARFMNIEPPGREQKFYSDFVPKIKHGDGAILKAQHWLSAQRERPIAVTDIAQYACLEPRTFLRRFVSATGMKPSEYQQRLRIARAREMLEFSRSSIDKIAESVGYDDVGGFRRVFRKIVGLTPSVPTATRTKIWERSGRDVNALPAVMEVEELVDCALGGFDQRETIAIPPLPDANRWSMFDGAARDALNFHANPRGEQIPHCIIERALIPLS